GGTVNGTITNSGTFNSTGGTLSGSLVNDGGANLNGNVILGAINGAGTTTVGNSAAPLATSVRQSALAIGAGSKLTVAPNGTTAGLSVLGALSIAGATDAWSGQLDI